MRTDLRIRKRLVVLMLALLMLMTAVCVRIASLTLVRGEALTARGVSQWTREGIVAAQRGAITDTKGEVVALSATAYIVTCNPKQVEDDALFARVVSELLSVDEESVRERVSRKQYASVILKRQVDRHVVDGIRALKQNDADMARLLKGVAFSQDTRRNYIKGAFLTQALGLTNVDSAGQSGLERRYDELLSGVPGKLLTEVDAASRMLPDGKTAYTPPEAGGTLVLTIDASIQGFVERAMRECIAVNSAKSVQCIVMDAYTGAVLALCMKPDYDPNDPPRYDTALLTDLMRITTVSDVYEPGSTFKILTAAAALDAGVTTPDDRFHCAGSIRVDGDTIRCWKNSHGAQSMAEGLQNSCNPVFVSLALRLGTDTFYRYLRAFGLGAKTGIELPGESAGLLINSKYVKTVDLARIGFGQSVAVTPLQMITAACAAVNGGRLMRPYIVKEELDKDGNVLRRTQAEVVSTPIREETSALMRQLLESVVTDGGGKNAAISGYRIGGKTGTAQVYKDGRVARDVHIGSFIGFAPADNPRFAVLVTVNEAIVPIDYGSVTAAPFARQIMEDTLAYLGVPKNEPKATAQPAVSVPDVTGLSVAAARKTLGDLRLSGETDGVSDTVSAQMPAPGAQLLAGGAVMLYTYEGSPDTPETMVCVPDVSGFSIVEAGRQLRARGLTLTLSGSGLAVSQSPAAGEYAAEGSEVAVTFEIPR